MDFNREWTQFALEAEYEDYGMARICKAHNDAMKAHLVPADLRFNPDWCPPGFVPESIFKDAIEERDEIIAKLQSPADLREAVEAMDAELPVGLEWAWNKIKAAIGGNK